MAEETREQDHTEEQSSGSSGESASRKKVRKNRKKSPVLRFLSALIPVTAVTVIVVCLVLSLRELHEYQEADQGYESLLNEAVQRPASLETGSEGTPDASDAATADQAAGAQAEDAENSAGVPGVDYPDLTIDYADLERVNSDFAGVLCIPVLDLIYPVAHSHDNTEYLTRTYYGEYNKCGSIFMDRYSSADYTDGNTFILGHNMRNMSMFGSLKRFEADPALCGQDPYIYIYTPDCIRKYRIFSYYEPSVNDQMYSADADYNNPDTYDAFVQAALRSSHYRTEETFDFSKRPRIVTLSTCWATDHTNNLVVHAYLTDEFRTAGDTAQ